MKVLVDGLGIEDYIHMRRYPTRGLSGCLPGGSGLGSANTHPLSTGVAAPSISPAPPAAAPRRAFSWLASIPQQRLNQTIPRPRVPATNRRSNDRPLVVVDHFVIHQRLRFWCEEAG